MRGVVALVAMAMGAVGLVATAAHAEPTPTPAPSAAAGKPVCTIDDSRLMELSGLVATRTGYIVINDKPDTNVASRDKIFYLDRSCRVVDTVSYAAPGSRDPEDAALQPDGTLWVA